MKVWETIKTDDYLRRLYLKYQSQEYDKKRNALVGETVKTQSFLDFLLEEVKENK